MAAFKICSIYINERASTKHNHDEIINEQKIIFLSYCDTFGMELEENITGIKCRKINLVTSVTFSSRGKGSLILLLQRDSNLQPLSL